MPFLLPHPFADPKQRRTAQRPPPGVAPTAAPALAKAKATVEPAEEEKTHADTVSQSSVLRAGASKVADPKSATSKPPARAPVKREQSDIFKAFTKPKSQIKREDTNTSTDSKTETKAKEEDGMSSGFVTRYETDGPSFHARRLR